MEGLVLNSPWTSCPADVLLKISRQANLSTRDVIALSLVCREWRLAILSRTEVMSCLYMKCISCSTVLLMLVAADSPACAFAPEANRCSHSVTQQQPAGWLS